MNVKLSHDVSFSADVIEGTKVFPNFYNVKINMETLTEDNVHQNIAIQRIVVFLTEIINGSVFCCEKNPAAIKFARIAKGSRVIMFPEEPFDQILGMILFQKLNAIIEDKMEIESVTISSELAQHLTFTVDDFEEFKYTPIKDELPWWNRRELIVSNDPKKIKASDSWDDYGLDWNSVDIVLDLEHNKRQPVVIILDGGGAHV